MANVSNGVSGYIDEQIEALSQHVPAALEAFDEKGVHQARVATRRLKAALGLLEPVLDAKAVAPIARTGRKLRRRLGPLRDLDVMIGHLAELENAPKFTAAVGWLRKRLEAARLEARREDVLGGKRSGKLLREFAEWDGVRSSLESESESIKPLIVNTLHEQFDSFYEQANRVAGVTPKEGDDPIDIHVLRVNGKNLRYTFEIAVAEGMLVPKPVLSTFKALQDSLGTWHDYVVLAEQALKETLSAELSHHSPELAYAKLELAKLFLGNGSKALLKFGVKWRKNADELKNALHDAVPLTQDVSATLSMPVAPAVIESETDRDPPESDAPSATDTPSPTRPPDIQV